MGEQSHLSRIDELERILAEAYLVVGSLAEASGLFESPEVQKVLDNLSQQRLVHDDVLPFQASEYEPEPVLVSYAEDMSTCTLNAKGEEFYYNLSSTTRSA